MLAISRSCRVGLQTSNTAPRRRASFAALTKDAQSAAVTEQDRGEVHGDHAGASPEGVRDLLLERTGGVQVQLKRRHDDHSWPDHHPLTRFSVAVARRHGTAASRRRRRRRRVAHHALC